MKTRRLRIVFTLLLLCFCVSEIHSIDEESAAALFINTLSLDIETASYYELVMWCKTLGLSEKGSKIELQRRLYQHYDISKPKEDTVIEKKRNVIIKSARVLEYYKEEIIDESYVLFTGKVYVEVTDPETSSVHTIRAERILLNETKDLLYAEGGVEYILKKKESTDRFSGESLLFNTNTFEGSFLQGVSEKSTKIDDKDIIFYFSGETIRRSEGNIITLKDGTITSCSEEDPHYHIKAKKIWVLSPDEWAIQNAVLYIGHLPVMYIPYFFHPGDEFFFHPSLGYRNREGYYIQTTTYLLGKKERKESSFSFLQIAEGSGSNYELKQEGLFLRKITSDKEQKNEANYFKIMLDTYSRLGFFLGADLLLENLGVINKISFTGGIARSRTLNYSDGIYSPYFETTEGDFISLWNNSYISNISLPIRYGGDFQFSLKNKHTTITGLLPLYSDVYFKRDFFTRDESIDWSALLELEAAEETSTTATAYETYKWQLSTVINPDVSILRPYISSFRIPRFDFEMTWKSKAYSQECYNEMFKDLSIRPSEFPEERFYFPESAVTPNLSASISGVLFSYKTGGDQAKKKEAETGPQDISIIAPWQDGEEKSAEQDERDEADDAHFKRPSVQPSVPIDTEQKYNLFSHELSYSINPYGTLTSRFNTASWDMPENIDLSVLYSIFNLRGTANLNYKSQFLEKAVIIQNSLSFSGNYNKHLSTMDEEITEWDSWLISDQKSSFMRLSDTFNITLAPFFTMPALAASNIKYTLTSVLWKYEYDSEEELFKEISPEWTKDYITSHKLEFLLAPIFFGQNQKLSISMNLPPLGTEIAPSLNLLTGPLSSSISTKFTKESEESEWVIEPVYINEILTIGSAMTLRQQVAYDFMIEGFTEGLSSASVSLFNKKVTFSEEITYDLQRKVPLISRTTINLWFIKAAFEARETYPYVFSLSEGWLKQEELTFLPYSLSAGLTYDYKPEPFWKNRIKITASATSLWNMNLIRFTENSLTFNFAFKLNIKEFLDLSISTTSENRATYRYFRDLSDKIEGVEYINPLEDLMKSFNFFNIEDRYSSGFKLRTISIKAVHKMHDWDLSFEYSGKPELITDSEGFKRYEWTPSFTINVQWHPIPEIKRTIQREKDDITF